MLGTLDYFANHPFVLVLTVIMIFILFYLILFRTILVKIFPAKSFLKNINILILFIVLPAILTVPIFGTLGAKYGRTTGKPVFTAYDANYIYVMSPVQKTGKSVYTNHRMHKIKLETGDETDRYALLRNFEKNASGLIGEILWVEFPSEKKLTGINITNGEKQIIDENYLQSIDKLSSIYGIQKFTVDFSIPEIQIFRKDGSDTVINPFKTEKFTDVIIYTKNETQPLEETGFLLTGETRKKLELNGKPVLPEKFWINGKILSHVSNNKQLIIAGYKTTENTHPVIECFSYDLKQEWSISTPEIPEGEIGNSLFVDGSIIICVGNSILSINLQTGKLNWCKKI